MLTKFEFDYDKCIEAKKTLAHYDIAQTIYKKNFSYRPDIGDCTYLCRLLLPISYEDFYNKYFEYAETHIELSIEKRGLTYDEMINNSKRFKQLLESKINDEYDVSVYFYALVCHAIVETFDGKGKEAEFFRYVNDVLGYKCEYFDSAIDTRFGVDIKTTINDDKSYALQVKPDSFFFGNSNTSLNEDRLSMINKRKKMWEKFGLNTLYAVYNKRGSDAGKWYLNENDKFLFKLEQLLDFDTEHFNYELYDYSSPKDKEMMLKSIKVKRLPERKKYLFC